MENITPGHTAIGRKKIDFESFLRQLFVCSGPWTIYFMQGICVGIPTVIVPQMRRANQTIDDEAASWLPTTHVYSGIPWAIFVSVLTINIGRKKSHIIVCSCALVGFLILFFSTKISHILYGEIFQGAVSSSSLTTCIIIVAEYVSSKNRGIFMTIKSATFFWGILVANAIGTFFHWQNIAILGIICSIYALLNVIIWPESPLWLASKGRFEECAAAHKWLKGEDVESLRELENMLNSYRNKLKLVKRQKWSFESFLKFVCRKQFIKPIILSNLLTYLYAFSGKLTCSVYAIEILKKITNSESTAYTGMLILDGVTVFSMYIGCFISRVFKRKVLLINFTILGVVFMILLSGYLFLVNLKVLNENTYVSLTLLAGYSISVCCGPMIMSTSIMGELLPLESRTLSMCIIALCFKFVYGTFLKVSPFCFKTLSMHGTFLLYAVLSTICLIIINFYLPETKDKTLQEINDCLKGKRNEDIEEGVELMDVNDRKLEITTINRMKN